MKNKIKFQNFIIPAKMLRKGREYVSEVQNPTPYANPPDGQYLVRGSKKNCYREYAKTEGAWYLLRDIEDDISYYYIIAAIYDIRPHLTDSEWLEISKHFNKLSAYWKRMVYGHRQWVICHNIGRKPRFQMRKILGRLRLNNNNK